MSPRLAVDPDPVQRALAGRQRERPPAGVAVAGQPQGRLVGLVRELSGG
jgi:hypothetical protein